MAKFYSARSKTIPPLPWQTFALPFSPKDIPFDAFKDIYLAAYEAGCKGCTTYRPNAVTGSVLSV